MKEPNTCPECRRSVVLQQTNRIYFNLSNSINNVQDYIDQLCSDLAARHNDLYVAKMHLDHQKSEWNIKLREKNDVVDKLNAKIDKLKLKIEKLKGVSMSLSRYVLECVCLCQNEWKDKEMFMYEKMADKICFPQFLGYLFNRINFFF